MIRWRIPLDDAYYGDAILRSDDGGATWFDVFSLTGSPSEVSDYEVPAGVTPRYRLVRALTAEAQEQ